MRNYGLYVNGQFVQSTAQHEIISPLTGLSMARSAFIDDKKSEILEAALDGAQETFAQILNGFFPLHERLDFVKKFRNRIESQSEAFIHNIVFEVGKPLKLARLELNRGLKTIDWSLHAAASFFNISGLPSGHFPEHEKSWAWSDWVPRGPLLAISPFNFPLNLTLHKIVPAWLAGCPVILKPSSKATLTALTLADTAHACGLPPGLLSVLPCSNELTEKLCLDERVSQISFTGSEKVGWALAAKTTKPFVLELGGHAPVFVDSSADLQKAAQKIVLGAFSFAGQSCISVQNIFVHPKALGDFKRSLELEIKAFSWGDARNEEVLSSVVIDEEAAERLNKAARSWEEKGAKSFATGLVPKLDLDFKQKLLIEPKIFEIVPGDCDLKKEEIFGPFASLETCENLESFIEEVNAFPQRLQAAVFTSSLAQAQRAASALRYGGIMVNESPSYRMEPMPYGGFDRAGLGREGPRFALEAYCERRSIIVNGLN